MGKHAVSVTGYSLGHGTRVPHPDTGFILRASRIDKIYVHDDQVGPFARMEFDGQNLSVPIGGSSHTVPCIKTSWRGSENGAIGTGRAIPDILLIPLYHKIRMPFEVVHDVILGFNRSLENYFGSDLAIKDGIEWDIHLTSVNDLKAEILAYPDRAVRGQFYREVLTQGMPRWLWRAKAYSVAGRIMDLLFDATDIEQGQLFIRAVVCDEEFGEVLRESSQRPEIDKSLQGRRELEIYRWFREQARL